MVRDVVPPAKTEHLQATWGPYRFTVEQYHQMGRAGVFAPDEKTELWEGRVVPMSPTGEGHASNVRRISDLFRAKVDKSVYVDTQNPIRLSDDTEPEPDVMLLEFRSDYYASRHPRPEDIHLLIEVSDTTLQYDREAKMPKYAQSNIPESWVVDIQGGRVWVYRQPSPEGYLQIRAYGRGEVIGVLGLELSVDDILVGGSSEE